MSVAAASRPRRRTTLASEVVILLSKSTTRSVTSSVNTDWLTSRPIPASRPRASAKFSGGTLDGQHRVGLRPVVVSWPYSAPPRGATAARACSPAAMTSSTSTTRLAV